jgi:uncharacterized protein with HEPN domain
MKDDRLYLTHILEATEKVIAYTQGGYDDFVHDAKTQDAVIRNFEIIGEAARKVSNATKQSNAHLPWKAMIGLRNILIHDYAGVDFERVWDVIQNHLPKLQLSVAALLQSYPSQ